MQRRMEWFRRGGLLVLSLALTLALVEALLRLQQHLGPFVDLEFHNISNIPSEVLNHTHAAREDWYLKERDKYGTNSGLRYTNLYDAHGVRVDPLCRPEVASQPTHDVLFLGDSFIEGYDLANTLPRHVCNLLRERGRVRLPLRVLNAGTSSYSPSIFIAQAKLLIPALRPHLVVVDIDETDLGDDYLRYRELVVRDEVGRIIAVRSTPANRDFTGGFLRIKEAHHLSYLWRFVRRTFHTKLRGRTALDRGEMSAIDPLVFSSDSDASAEQRYSVEIGLFEARVDELVTTLIALLGRPDAMLLAYHPHRQHLQPGEDGSLWNNLVRTTVGRVARRHGVEFYDATEDLRRDFAGAPERFYWSNDMHFNFAGLAAYGRRLAERVEVRLLALDNTPSPP